MEGLPLVLFFTLLAGVSIYLKRQKRSRLPPGPKGLPIAGNAFDIPNRWEWIQYKKWCQQYGSDMIYLNVFGTPVVVLNSAEAAHDLFEKRSSIYSDRQYQIMLQDLTSWNQNIAFIGYGDDWRDRRRMFHQHFHPGSVHKYHSVSSKHAKRLLHRLLKDPDGFFSHLRIMGGSIILGSTFGIDVQGENDPYITTAEKALHSLAVVGNAGSYMVDYVPILRYLPSWAPGAQFKRDGARWKKDVTSMYTRPLQYVKQCLAKGTAGSSIAATLLGDLDPSKDNSKIEDVIRSVTGTAYVGGSDTSVSAMWTFVMAMILYPDVQKAAQAEIDRVIGPDRLPEHIDRDSLPYVTAVMREGLRWHPVTPLAVPHRLMVDDEYRGYHFPAGTVVVGNAWGMLHDEKIYPNPEAFDPTRWLTPDGKLIKANPDPLDSSFGFGRRICPGRHFAMDTIWTAEAHMLATFNIEKAIDEAGNAVEPTEEYTTGLITFPVPFKARFKPRSAAAEALIHASMLSE